MSQWTISKGWALVVAASVKAILLSSCTVWSSASSKTDGNAGEVLGGTTTNYSVSSIGLRASIGGVPAFFIFGDSTVDAGNNNHLQTLAQAGFWPYGKDFDTHQPTGRFCDGRLSVDYLANYLGLPLVPPFLAVGSDFSQSQGVNFASAGSGILPDTGSIFGEYISFSEQLNNFDIVKQTLTATLGASRVSQIMADSVFYISTGSNDIINNYLLPDGPHSQLNSADFQNLVLDTFDQQIRTLFKMGARKIVVVSLSPLGCLPSQLFKMGSQDGVCIAGVNDMAVGYNQLLSSLLHGLRRHLPGVKLVYNDAYLVFNNITDHAEFHGIGDTKQACCGGGPYGGMKTCMIWSKTCQNANNHLFWDEFHPTAAAYKLIADSFWSGPIQVSSPWNVQTLASL